jgi:hypothetical protein
LGRDQRLQAGACPDLLHTAQVGDHIGLGGVAVKAFEIGFVAGAQGLTELFGRQLFKGADHALQHLVDGVVGRLSIARGIHQGGAKALGSLPGLQQAAGLHHQVLAGRTQIGALLGGQCRRLAEARAKQHRLDAMQAPRCRGQLGKGLGRQRRGVQGCCQIFGVDRPVVEVAVVTLALGRAKGP